jgi:hypothetical protein
VKRPTAGIYGPLRSRSRCRSVLALLATAIMFALSTSLVVAMEDGLKRNLVGRNPIHALKLRWIQKERTSKQSGTPSSRPVRCSKHINGSCVVRKHPDRQSVASWFGLNDHNVRSGECEHRNRVRNAAAECNHPLAGMTNPTLHIFGRSSSRAIDRVIPASVSSKIQSGDSQNDSSPALP